MGLLFSSKFFVVFVFGGEIELSCLLQVHPSLKAYRSEMEEKRPRRRTSLSCSVPQEVGLSLQSALLHSSCTLAAGFAQGEKRAADGRLGGSSIPAVSLPGCHGFASDHSLRD